MTEETVKRGKGRPREITLEILEKFVAEVVRRNSSISKVCAMQKKSPVSLSVAAKAQGLVLKQMVKEAKVAAGVGKPVVTRTVKTPKTVTPPVEKTVATV